MLVIYSNSERGAPDCRMIRHRNSSCRSGIFLLDDHMTAPSADLHKTMSWENPTDVLSR